MRLGVLVDDWSPFSVKVKKSWISNWLLWYNRHHNLFWLLSLRIVVTKRCVNSWGYQLSFSGMSIVKRRDVISNHQNFLAQKSSRRQSTRKNVEKMPFLYRIRALGTKTNFLHSTNILSYVSFAQLTSFFRKKTVKILFYYLAIIWSCNREHKEKLKNNEK